MQVTVEDKVVRRQLFKYTSTTNNDLLAYYKGGSAQKWLQERLDKSTKWRNSHLRRHRDEGTIPEEWLKKSGADASQAKVGCSCSWLPW